jgi:predicted restriction endonuclease
LGNPHNGPDHKTNIINVCPNHHVELDYGAIKLELEKLALSKHRLNNEYIDYHNTHIFNGD